jgi:hypothetical protein
MLGFRGHFSTRTRHYSTTLTQLRGERSAWRTRQGDVQERAGEGQPVTDQHSDRVDRADLTAGHTDPDAGHRVGSERHLDTDTTLVISHWQYTGSGLLPELAHLADLLAAAPKARPEHAARSRQARRPSDLAGHSTNPLTTVTPAEVTG